MAARISVGVQRGLLLMARQPAASTWPRAECCSSWFTVSGVGTESRETPMASSTRLLPSTRLVLSLMKRSMMKASARMEHRMSGQMGQPAACMMEIKGFLSCGAAHTGWAGRPQKGCARLWRTPAPPRPPGCTRAGNRAQAHGSPPWHHDPRRCTDSVDNFVKNAPVIPPQACTGAALDRLMTQRAAKNQGMTSTCTNSSAFADVLARAAPAGALLWSTGRPGAPEMALQPA